MARVGPAWTQIADTFLEFFRARGHTVVPSSSLVPANDPTLLFTNAGMVQFKDAFLGLERRPYARAASLQKCMRVQGKHNDLENVGPSPWHHTFFLMLGNFSFGDYFKRDAVAFATDLVIRTYGVDPQRLIATVFETDDDAYDAWRAVEFPTDRILRMGEATNFWMMAETGPCGPTSELHYDWGPQACTCGRPDCSVALDNGCLRWLEIWNLVFMQFDQRADGTRLPLPRPGVDTGLGLERMACVLQGVPDDYGTDLFVPLMNRLQGILGHHDATRDAARLAYRVMADHGRAMTFLLADGVVPGNEGRGYVLRMIMRRAMRFARAAGTTQPFLAALAGAVVDEMGGVYPELVSHRAFVETAARNEEERFTQTLTNGLARLEELVVDARKARSRVLSGDAVFRLYDTYGFPIEMTRDVAREAGLQIDEAGFAHAMEEQRERARVAMKFTPSAQDEVYLPLVKEGIATEFVGYAKHAARGRITALLVFDPVGSSDPSKSVQKGQTPLHGGGRVDAVAEGQEVEVILDRTPFYAEGGGQVGDTGTLTNAGGAVEVRATRRVGGVILHRGVVTRGRLRVGQMVRGAIDAERRLDIMRNHTATHLLHRTLREMLGEHARQAGSLVAPDRLRFDFIHLSALALEQRDALEARVNAQILADLPVRARWLSYEDAVAAGALALFGEKYGDRVRMISIDGYSRELCGGTHLSRTGQIGLFKITSEGGVAAGVRRIEAVTGRGALALVARQDATLRAVAEQLRTTPEEIPERVQRLEERVRALERQSVSAPPVDETLRQLRERRDELVVTVDDTHFLFAELATASAQQLRAAADRFRHEFEARHEPAVVALGSNANGALVVTRTRNPVAAVDAGKFVRVLTQEFGGSGGGRADFGQGGLKDPSQIHDLIKLGRSPEFVRTVLKRLA